MTAYKLSAGYRKHSHEIMGYQVYCLQVYCLPTKGVHLNTFFKAMCVVESS